MNFDGFGLGLISEKSLSMILNRSQLAPRSVDSLIQISKILTLLHGKLID